MGEITAGAPPPNPGIDLSQFFQVFFDEAAENLERMETLLLGLATAPADDEALNGVFRCAHSIKGGAATFGFADVAELTHRMESLLDRLRRHELALAPEMVDVLLRAGDALRAQLARHRGDGGHGGTGADPAALMRELSAFGVGVGGAEPAPARVQPMPPSAAPTAAPEAPPPHPRVLELRVGPLTRASDADDLQELFTQIPDLGTLEPLAAVPGAGGVRRFKLSTASSDADLLDLFSLHVAREQLALHPFATAPSRTPAPRPAVPQAPRVPAAGPETATLRVSVEKVDQLINLVGELVITQAMLAQNSLGLDTALHRQLAAGLAHLERSTRELQESVMSIRMIPMSAVFSRFPRMLRDLAAKLGKEVEFATEGEATELDKGLVEKITDPLTHLVRNSCDHGIELPAERLAAGKPAQGTITLAASHQGGSIVIEVRDDGRGLSRATLLKKARERGLAAPDALSDAEVWSLIFAPGFTTASEVTDVSGRGVGMDVVKRSITALGGTVEIDSTEGHGMCVSVRLPLTLAIMDGMSVGVGGEVYVLPLSSVVESFQVGPGTVRAFGGSGRVVEVRSEYMPVLDLAQLFKVPRDEHADSGRAGGIVVVVEAEGGRAALRVDELLGQQQVVVKNLEANYRKVEDVSGATIMGDGRVALILDVGSIVRRSRH